MKRNWLIMLSLVGVLGIILPASCGSSNTGSGTVSLNTQQQGIWVTGQGKITAAPDIAILRLGIEAQEVSVD